MIYADFQSILVPEDNRKQNPNESYTNNYQKYAPCSYGYKLVYVDDNFSKYFKSYLGKDAAYNFISSMIEENKYSSDAMKKYFNKDLVMIKKGNEDWNNSTQCWMCDNDHINNDVKLRDHCHITEKYIGSANGDCNINVKLNHKIPIEFHNLKNYDLHLIMQEPSKFNQVNATRNGLEKYMSFSINNK